MCSTALYYSDSIVFEADIDGLKIWAAENMTNLVMLTFSKLLPKCTAAGDLLYSSWSWDFNTLRLLVGESVKDTDSNTIRFSDLREFVHYS